MIWAPKSVSGTGAFCPRRHKVAGRGGPPPTAHLHWSKMTFSWRLLSCKSFTEFCNFFSCSNSFLCSLVISAFISPASGEKELEK